MERIKLFLRLVWRHVENIKGIPRKYQDRRRITIREAWDAQMVCNMLNTQPAVEADTNKCPNCVTGKFKVVHICNKCGHEQCQ